MNERIRELEKQATDYYSNGQERIFDRQKFAQLIIQECMDNLAWHGHDEAVSQLNWFLVNKIRS